MALNKLITYEKFDYFMEQTNKSLDQLKTDIFDVRKDISDLRSFRMALVGASAGFSVIATAAFNLALIWATHKG